MEGSEHLFPYRWNLSDGYPAKGVKYHGKTVFGTFICGGGSSMGYKLAGFHHLGGVELDPKVAAVYKANHNPEHLFNMDIRDFNGLENLPPELYNLDLLDGSPPCSTFSMAGDREKAWGKKKRFDEGQKLQTLDDLVFVYCDTIRKLMPKVCLLENVSGLIKGNAKAYAKKIADRIREAGYRVQVFLLNAAFMCVPQKRERVFFIGLRNDFPLPKLKLEFNERPIPFGEIIDREDTVPNLTEHVKWLWDRKRKSDIRLDEINLRERGKASDYSHFLIHSDKVCNTMTASGNYNPLYDIPRYMNMNELKQVSTFPMDYRNEGKGLRWLCGMSVPPVMMAQIANQIYLQWLSKI